jgi:hypothetical protein
MSIWKKFFGKKEAPQQESRIAGQFMGMPVVDLRDEKERQIEKKAYAGESLGPEVDRLVAELMQIGRTDGYLSMQPGGKFNENCRHIRAREIGEALNKRGGMDLMQAAYYRVRAALPDEARSLESAWGYIGEWLP